MIRAIFLDLGNVLIPFDNRRFFRRISAYSRLSHEEIGRRFAESPLAPRYESGKISSQRFYREICALIGAKVEEEPFFQAWSSIFDLKPSIDGAYLEALAHRYTLVLVSNTNARHFAFVKRRFPMLRAFHHFALSYRVGAKKPKPEVYLAALSMSGAPAARTFYADDIEEYVEAGREMGMRAARVRSGRELLDQMAMHGVRVPGRRELAAAAQARQSTGRGFGGGGATQSR